MASFIYLFLMSTLTIQRKNRYINCVMHPMLYVLIQLIPVFVALTQLCVQVQCTLYTDVPCSSRTEGYLYLQSLPTCEFDGSKEPICQTKETVLIYFLGLVKLKGLLYAIYRANPQFLQIQGEQQLRDSYKTICVTKLHPSKPKSRLNYLPQVLSENQFFCV